MQEHFFNGASLFIQLCFGLHLDRYGAGRGCRSAAYWQPPWVYPQALVQPRVLISLKLDMQW